MFKNVLTNGITARGTSHWSLTSRCNNTCSSTALTRGLRLYKSPEPRALEIRFQNFFIHQFIFLKHKSEYFTFYKYFIDNLISSWNSRKTFQALLQIDLKTPRRVKIFISVIDHSCILISYAFITH